jgi:hypothetical protein
MRVMHVREVRMLVPQPVMPMGMGMRLPRRIIGRVLMSMVLIMHVGVRMFHWLMNMFMLVMLGQVQPHADTHQQSCRKKLNGHRLAQEDYSRERAQKRRR